MDRLDALSCTSSERSCIDRQMRDPRINRIFDQAVICTHDRSAMRSEMTAWRVPRTGDHQKLLNTTAQIIDTDIRQKATRDLKKWLLERKNPGSTGLLPDAASCGGGVRLSHNGQLPKHLMNKSRSMSGSSSSGGQLSESGYRASSERYLPPWVSQSQWEQAIKPSHWTVSAGPGGHWAGAAVLPSRLSTPSQR